MDKWDRKTNFNCDSCMFYVPKKDATIGGIRFDMPEGRCRRNAPTMKGYPVVWSSDWCGEHKIGSNPVRDGNSVEEQADSLWNEPKPLLCVQHGGDPTCEGINKINKLVCPKCEEKPLTNSYDELKGKGFEITDVLPGPQCSNDPKEKAKIKSNICELTANINARISNTAPQTDIDYICGKTQIIRELLEKL